MEIWALLDLKSSKAFFWQEYAVDVFFGYFRPGFYETKFFFQ
ncbi:hypothetical protein P872_11260 [Rhodonellum psychrophilum GCM71 = DSM 17998]|uniref:Uncharacterized protein n=1 Tax=Rhodonellum psychrophilum GCM71 = DSM 17998 TaxID=1123057 RepID=U5BTD6_9BACT|nr:hypothetical protein P872_11260 [Rhodonellum psychrophilum GCM71 = DSM 17998]